MLALALALALARGAEPSALDALGPPAGAAVASTGDHVPWGALGVLGISLGGWGWFVQRKKRRAVVRSLGQVRIVSRAALSRDAQAVVLEIEDANGPRLLLVGIGGGAPRLLTELDGEPSVARLQEVS